MAGAGAIPYRTYSTTDFIQRFSNIAQTSQFRAIINIQNLPFTSTYAPANRYTEDLSILCCETSLPGSRFSTTENNQDYYGVSQKFAYRRDFDSMDMSFYVDSDYKIMKFFEQWMDFIASPDQSYSTVGDNVASNNSFYRFKYPSFYKTNMYIHKFNKDYDNIKSEIVYNFVDAFPINMSSIPVSYDASQLLKVSVSFSFDRYYINRSGATISSIQSDSTTASNSSGNQNGAVTPSQSSNTGGSTGQTPFTSKTTTLTNEYYNNFGDVRQDITNFGRGIA